MMEEKAPYSCKMTKYIFKIFRKIFEGIKNLLYKINLILYGFKLETGSDWLTVLGLSDVVATIRALLQYSVFIGVLCLRRGLFINNSTFSYNKSIYSFVW